MKRLLLANLLVILGVMQLFALRTTISSSIYTDSAIVYQQSPQFNYAFSLAKRVNFINHIDTIPDFEIALSAAEHIFTEMMLENYVELVNITADISMGDSNEFLPGEICKVDIVYTDTLVYNANYPHFQWSVGQYLPTLYPMAISNQSRGNNYGPAMYIKLRPDIEYHCDTTMVPDDHYDAITLLLRALVMGCGLQSTFRPNNGTLSFGIQIGQQKYINAFDSRIYNDVGRTYEEVALGFLNPNQFLNNHPVYIDTYTSTIELTNDLLLSNACTFKTLNTISPSNYTDDEINEGFYDLMEGAFEMGFAVREITPYTMSMLKQLGWMWDLAVGYDPYADLYDSQICCSSYILSPNVYYTLSTDYNNVNLGDIHCKLFSKDSTYEIGQMANYGPYFYYNSIPDNVQWKRNPYTHNIVGQFQGYVYVMENGNMISQEKMCDIEIPYRPNKPIVKKSETTDNSGIIHLNLKAFANGSETYTVKYKGVNSNDSVSFTVAANTLDTILLVPDTQTYNMSIYGTNYMGNSDLYTFTFGSPALPYLTLVTFISGTTLYYDLSNLGVIDISNLTINYVQIADLNGLVWLTPNAGNMDPIDMSSLPRGYYLLTVIANGHTYTRQFYKRR